MGFDHWPLRERGGLSACSVRGGRGGEKPGIPHLIVVIGFSLGVLLALDFKADELLYAFSWVHNGWRLSAGDFFLGGPSTILIGPL